MSDCIFCNIIRENKLMKVYEDDWTVAFMDIAKDVDGHIVAMPRMHVKNILDCDSDLLSKLMNCVKKVSNHLVDNCGYDGVNLLNASDESAGQSVPHFHIHIIPRKTNDEIDAWPAFDGAKQEIECIWEKIKNAIANKFKFVNLPFERGEILFLRIANFMNGRKCKLEFMEALYMQTFTLDLSERKRILKNISSKDHTWKVRMSFAVILFLAAVGIIGYTVYLLISHPTSEEGVFIFICAGICFACIPFFVALSVKNTAKYKCAFPYTAYANGSLNLYDDKLEYIFWRVGPHEPAAYSSKRAVYRAEDKFVFSIDKKDIVSIIIKDDICMIKGNGIVKMPEWAIEDAAVKIKNKEFSFIMAFEQKDTGKTIEKWAVD